MPSAWSNVGRIKLNPHPLTDDERRKLLTLIATRHPVMKCLVSYYEDPTDGLILELLVPGTGGNWAQAFDDFMRALRETLDTLP